MTVIVFALPLQIWLWCVPNLAAPCHGEAMTFVVSFPHWKIAKNWGVFLLFRQKSNTLLFFSAIMCPFGMSYQPCGPVCEPTCEGIGLEPESCCQTDYCVEGCFCPPGTYLHSKNITSLLMILQDLIDHIEKIIAIICCVGITFCKIPLIIL